MNISIVGNIGAGKSTIARMVSDEMKLEFIEEEVKNNPVLYLLYNDLNRYSFLAGQWFLFNFAEKIHGKKNFVIDRHPYETTRIFSTMFFENGLMNEIEYNTHIKTGKFCDKFMPKIDYMFYLRTEPKECFNRILHRFRLMNRGNEEFKKRLAEVERVDYDYLKKLHELYEKNFSDCIILDGKQPKEKILEEVVNAVKN